jgi:hypothetical protein
MPAPNVRLGESEPVAHRRRAGECTAMPTIPAMPSVSGPAPACSVCDVPLARWTLHPPGRSPVCQSARCIAEGLRRDDQRFRANRHRTLREQMGGTDPVVFVPSNRQETVRTAAWRRRVLAEHLTAVIADALATPASSMPEASEEHAPTVASAAAVDPLAPFVESSPSLGDVSASGRSAEQEAIGTACGACRGACCRAGATTAWVSADTIRRVRQGEPNTSGKALLARYLEEIPSRSVRGGCVYLGARGCELSAVLRSDTCHRYLCDGVSALVRLVREQPEQPVRVAATEGSRVVRVRRIVPRAPSAAPPSP